MASGRARILDDGLGARSPPTASSSLRELLTRTVIQKAVAFIRVDVNRGIQTPVTNILLKWGAKIVVDRELIEFIAHWSSNPTETLIFMLEIHKDSFFRWELLEHILRSWNLQNDCDRLRLIRQCDPADLTQDTLESVVSFRDRRVPFATLTVMMECNPKLVVNERLVICGAAAGWMDFLLEEILPEDASLLTQDVLVTAAEVCGYNTIKTIMENSSLIVSDDVLIAILQNRELGGKGRFRKFLDERFTMVQALMVYLENNYQFEVTERVLRTALARYRYPGHNISFIAWLTTKGQLYQGPIVEEVMLTCIWFCDTEEYTQTCIRFFERIRQKATLRLTEQMLRLGFLPSFRSFSPFSRVLAPLFSWMLKNCECCIDKQAAFDNAVRGQMWDMAIMLHKSDESLEVSMEALDRMRKIELE